MSVVDRKFLFTKASNHVVKHFAQSIKVRSIEDVIVSSSEYTLLEISFLGKLLFDKIALGKIRRHVHIVDNLKTNLLMGLDILGLE